ncbi:MAG: lytic murein transglycosylase B [Methylococcales bacterium]|nr:lytic murein transglycosylase B [Methylococcales bacterium]
MSIKNFSRHFAYILTVSVALNLTSCSTTPEHEITPIQKPKDIAPPVQVEPQPIVKPPMPEATTTPLSINQNVKNFVRQMVTKHHFDERDLTQLLQSAVIKDDILKRISSPSEGLPWHKYRKIFLTQARIDSGVKFWQENAQALATVSQQTGVAPEMIVAIIGVETGYGKNMGNHRVLDALATLAFAYPPRSPFFTGELEQFLLLCREENKDSREPLGSYAGAMGYPQFMPSSFRALAKDFEHDGKRDIWQNPRDAIASVGYYFQQNGWQEGQDVAKKANAIGSQYKAFLNKDLKPNATVGQLAHTGVNAMENIPAETKVKLVALEQVDGDELWLGFHNFYVITRYNHSPLYAMAAFQLSQEIKQRR